MALRANIFSWPGLGRGRLSTHQDRDGCTAGNVDSSAVLIKSLLDSAQKLTMEVQSLRQESQDFRKLATIPPARDPPPSYSLGKNAATGDITLSELRAMTALASKVDR